METKRYDEIDMKLAFDLLLSRLEILDDAVHEVLQQEEDESTLSREELLRKYRIREPSEEEIERILQQME